MSRPWYIRNQQQVVRGPFPARQVAQEVLLGRVKADDMVSQDQETWKPLKQVAELIPDVFKGDRADPDFKKRVEAARRWADERRGDHDSPVHVPSQRKALDPAFRHTSPHLHNSQVKPVAKTLVPVMSILFLLSIMIYMAFNYAPQQENAVIDCTAKAHARVNWQNCRLDGLIIVRADLREANLKGASLVGGNLLGSNLQLAELQYSNMSRANLAFTDFSHAKLKGANLQAADLQQSHFNHADLSYANLQNAIIKDSNFDNARLDHAIWIDGKECLQGSVGQCIVK